MFVFYSITLFQKFMEDLKICTCNVRGLRNVKKRRQQFIYFHRHNFDIILAQETHSTARDVCYWKSEWGGEIVFSHGTNLSKGVAILFNPRLSIDTVDVNSDQNGRYIIADLKVEDCILTIVCSLFIAPI